MVSGAAGIVTHSGHWYKCRNGHTVCFPVRTPFQSFMFYADRAATVCNWRVWDAHGARPLSRMPGPNWGTGPRAGRGRDPGYGYGVVRPGKSMTDCNSPLDDIAWRNYEVSSVRILIKLAGHVTVTLKRTVYE
jgi:hypothetical protein